LPIRCQILRPKCTKFDFGRGSAPDPADGAPSDPVAGFKGRTSNGREGKEGKEQRGGERGEEECSFKFATTPLLVINMLGFAHCT